MLDIVVFNVEHGQSIFFYPRNNVEYGMFVDCGNTQDFNPIDFLIKHNLVHRNGLAGGHVVSNLTLTNYDQDHFSGLPHLMGKAHITTIRFAPNLTSTELVAMKEEQTEALDKVCQLKDKYTASAEFHRPPYEVTTFSLTKTDFPEVEPSTNNLSQVVFVRYGGSTICITGDVEASGWEKLLAKPGFTDWLGQTNVLVAAHHGRENGYAEEIFAHCAPECVIFSDKLVVHGTQEGMSQAYAAHVTGNGVIVNGNTTNSRKVLTTRSDGHIWIRFTGGGIREYKTIIA